MRTHDKPIPENQNFKQKNSENQIEDSSIQQNSQISPEKMLWKIARGKTNIQKIIVSDWNYEQKKKQISYIIIDALRAAWVFYKTKKSVFYFFDTLQKRVFKTKEQDFKFLLNEYFGINGSTDYYKYLMEELGSYISKNAKEVTIYDFSYYDTTSNTLYIHNNGIKIIKISHDKIEEVENGYNGIIFEIKSWSQDWNLLQNSSTILGSAKLTDLIAKLNYDTDSTINKEDYTWMLENYIYALFFPNLLNTRPILAFIGNKWSWKSFFLKLLLYIFYGEGASLSNLPSNDEEFKNSLMNNYLYFIDNLDDSISKTKIDILCSVATGIGIKKRVLYTDMTELSFKVNSFLAITSRTPKFKRVDLNERLLIIKLQSLEEYTSETQLFSEIDRNEMMTYIMYNLQILLQNIDTFQYFKTNFRIADFANIIYNFRINNKTHTEIKDILESFTREQENFSMESDPLVELIERVMTDWENEWKSHTYTAHELHQTLSVASYKYSMKDGRSLYSIKSPIGLGKKLSEMQKWLTQRFSFRIEKWSSNTKNYIFWSMKKVDIS